MLQAYYKGTNVKVRTGETIITSNGQIFFFNRATRKTELGKSGKITVTTGMEYYAHIFGLEVKEINEYKQKFDFVQQDLLPLLQSVNDRVMNAEYRLTEDNNEYVVIKFFNNYIKNICVTCDSLKAITLNVLKEI